MITAPVPIPAHSGRREIHSVIQASDPRFDRYMAALAVDYKAGRRHGHSRIQEGRRRLVTAEVQYHSKGEAELHCTWWWL